MLLHLNGYQITSDSYAELQLLIMKCGSMFSNNWGVLHVSSGLRKTDQASQVKNTDVSWTFLAKYFLRKRHTWLEKHLFTVPVYKFLVISSPEQLHICPGKLTFYS